MSSDTSHDRLIGTVSLILDRMVHVRLTAVGITRPEVIDRTPADPVEFWEQSRVHDPRPIRVNREWESLGGPRWRELELEGDSEGPGGHWGSRRLVATAHVRREPGPAPFVLLLHGYAVPQTTYDRWLAKQMRLRGAHTARLDLPLPPAADAARSAQRRRLLQPRSRAYPRGGPPIRRGRRGGDRLGTRRGQPARERRRRQPWRIDRDPAGGAARARPGDRGRAVLRPGDDAVAAAADPVAPPPRHDRRVQRVVGSRIGRAPVASSSRRSRRCVARNLTPRTPGDRITLVRAMQDLVVGPDPVTELAGTMADGALDLPARAHDRDERRAGSRAGSPIAPPPCTTSPACPVAV